MESTNWENYTVSDSEKYEDEHIGDIQLYVVIFFSISNAISGTVANTVTIAAIISGKLYKHSGFVKILNLLVCNLIHCAVFLPLMTVQAFTGFWTNNALICNAVSFGLFCNLGTELFGYVCISLNRYFCIVNHRMYNFLYGSSTILAIEWIICWLIYPVIMALPLFGIWSHYEYAPRKLICHPFIGEECTGYCLFVFTFAIATTMPVIGFCYLKIIITYFKVHRNVLKHQDSTKSNSVRSTTHLKADHARRKSELKMAFTILAVILFFGLFRIPFIMLYIYDPSMTKVDPIIHTVIIYAGTIMNWVNPIIYAMTNQQLRTAVKHMIYKDAARQQLSRELRN